MIASWRPDPPAFAGGRIGHIASTSYTSSGVTSPVSAGVYTWAGEYAGQLYFRRADGAFFIWWDSPTEKWFMSTGPGIGSPGFWRSPTSSVVGTYSPTGTYTGNPIVVVTP
jgi:hypothetical protein